MAIAFSLLSLCLAGFLFLRMQAAENQIKQLKHRLDESEEARDQLEQSLLVFADDMKEGNERVLTHVLKGKQKNEEEDHRSITKEKQPLTHHVEKEEVYIPPIPDEQADSITYEQSPQAKILALHNKGLTSVEIAKRLDMGKGEVELFIKFQQSTK
jgi:hypothetical protein